MKKRQRKKMLRKCKTIWDVLLLPRKFRPKGEMITCGRINEVPKPEDYLTEFPCIYQPATIKTHAFDGVSLVKKDLTGKLIKLVRKK
jgi:hypothetical protein